MNEIAKWQKVKNDFMGKASVVHSTIYASMYGEPQWTDTNYDALSREGYNQSVWAYACIDQIASSSADIPLLLYKRQGKQLVEIEDHPLLDLLKKPNPLQSGRELREAWGKYLLISGRSFIEKTYGATRVAELWAMRPDQVAIVPSKTDVISAYVYRGDTSEEKILKANQLMFWKSFNPLDQLEGKSPLEIGSRIIDMEAEANKWNKSLLENGGTPTGVVTTDQQLDDNTFNRMSAMIKRVFGRRKNVGKVPLLDAGSKYQSTGFSPKDIMFKELKLLNRVEICAVFNVPPEIVGDGQNKTYSNYQEARASFYQETVLPFTGHFIDKLNADLVPLFGDNLLLAIDRDKVEALRENADSKYKRVLEAVREGVLTPDEGREELGYSPKGGDADQLRDPSVQKTPEAAQPSSEGDTSSASKNRSTGQNNPFDKGIESIKNVLALLETKKDDPDAEDEAYFQLVEKEREPFYKKATALFTKRLADEGDALATALEAGGVEAFEKELTAQEKQWHLTMVAVYYGTIEHFGGWSYDRLKEQHDKSNGAGVFEQKFFDRLFTMARRAIQKFIGESSVFAVVEINKFTRETLRAVISDGIAASKSFMEISRDIRKIYGEQFGPRRAIKIARTEIVSASNFGAREGAKATGLDLVKTWVTTKDGRQRDSHDTCHGQTRDMDEPYDVGGSPGMFPGDPKLPANQRIQCRCAEKHDVKE